MKKLFLHLGPGGNHLTDKEFISSPDITFWTQPLFDIKEKNYISQLLNSLEREINLISKDESSIELIAHSFSSFLAINLPQSCLDRVNKITFIAPTFNYLDSILNFIKVVSKHDTDIKIQKFIYDFEKNLSLDLFWKIFELFCASHPDFIKYYFSKEEDFLRFSKVASKYPPLHEESFFKGTSELITDHRKKLVNYPSLKMEKSVIIGANDPFINTEMVKEMYNFFGEENVSIVKGGHFPHIDNNIKL